MAGVILEQATDQLLASSQGVNGNTIEERILMPFVVSAKTPDALEVYLKKYLIFCQTASDASFNDICYTACVGREHYRHRFVCVASDMADLRSRLEERIKSAERTHYDTKVSSGTRIAFTFPGQGSQYQGMASDLASCYSDFKGIIERNSAAAAEISGFPIASFLLDKDPSYHLTIDDSRIGQICIFVYQCSISLWLNTLGVEASAALGHSFGEISAAGELNHFLRVMMNFR